MTSQPDGPTTGVTDLAVEVSMVDLTGRAEPTAKRQKRRLVALVAVLGLALVGAAALVTTRRPSILPSIGHTPTPTPISPGPEVEVSPPAGELGPVTYVADPRLTNWQSSRINLPIWRGPDSGCPAGWRQFWSQPGGQGGLARVNEKIDYIMLWQPLVSADLDGDSRPDDLLTIWCGSD